MPEMKLKEHIQKLERDLAVSERVYSALRERDFTLESARVLIKRAYWQAISPVLFTGDLHVYHHNLSQGMRIARAAEALGVEL